MNEAISNPPQGTYVDQGFVEQETVIEGGAFDFFLVPHSVTQGAVKPTHFYVASNTSSITKDAILNFTYGLCYNYYNWADSIKIPAPCMLADKIAIYRSEIGNIPASMDLHRLPFFL
jgi:aubergine-like protein